MPRPCLAIILVLLLVIAGGAWKFLVQGSVSEADDGRTAIHLTPGERDIVLAEMRAFLASVQAITEGLSNDDMERVAGSAREVGQAARAAVPGTLMGKLPVAFKTLGFDTHARFDRLALDAEQLGDGAHTLEQLSELMRNCVACHAGHRIEVTAR